MRLSNIRIVWLIYFVLVEQSITSKTAAILPSRTKSTENQKMEQNFLVQSSNIQATDPGKLFVPPWMSEIRRIRPLRGTKVASTRRKRCACRRTNAPSSWILLSILKIHKVFLLFCFSFLFILIFSVEPSGGWTGAALRHAERARSELPHWWERRVTRLDDPILPLHDACPAQRRTAPEW